MYEEPLFLPEGDQAMVVELGDGISPEINRRVRNLTLAVEKAALPGVLDMVPTYRSLLIFYDPTTIATAELQDGVRQVDLALDEQSLEKPSILQIPTRYGGEHGPDLEYVAEHAELTTAEVVSIHSDTDYLVYMMGFTPGFPYLGGLSERIVTPRLETPRKRIAAGSVGIAEGQTGVYPAASPGGWRLIGRTPLKLFDPDREAPALLSAGDYVHFAPISTDDEYIDVQRRVESGEYEVVKEFAP